MTAELIRHNLCRTLNFIEPFLPLIDSHMVTFITDSLYSNMIPSKIKCEVEELGAERVLDMCFRHCQMKFVDVDSEVGNFLNKILEIHNFNRSIDFYSLDSFKNMLYEKGAKKFSNIRFDEFMSSKKCHEVTLMSAAVAELADYTDSSVVVDIGDGKGYLSSFLALEYRLRVLGVDSSSIKTKGAAKRCLKLSKIWKGTRKKISLENESNDVKTNSTGNADYRQTTEFINEKTDISDIVSREFKQNINGIGLTGLHTCGDLASVCLKSFVKNSDQKFIINVGCCYHLLTEDSSGTRGFPLSKFVLNKGLKFGRNVRMVSLKPKWKIGYDKNLPSESLLYRAILQKIFVDKKGSEISDEFQVGRIASKCSSFTEYVRMAITKLKLDIKMSDEEIQEYYDFNSHFKSQLWIYFMFLTCLSSLIEDVILLDRLLYLKEQKIVNSYLVEMFDPVISPRCYGIIGFRQLQKENTN